MSGLARSFRRRVRGRVVAGPPPPPPPYHPTSEAGLWAYYEGHLDGSGQWSDMTGNGRHGTQATVDDQPANGTDALDRDCLVFDATKYLYLPAMHSLTQGAVYVAVAADADPAAQSSHVGLWHAGGSGVPTVYPWTNGHLNDDCGSTVRREMGVPGVTMGDMGLSLADLHVYSVKSTPSIWEARIDGDVLYSTETNTVGFPGDLYLPVLGRASNPDLMFKGKVTALAIFSTPPSDDAELLAYMMGA